MKIRSEFEIILPILHNCAVYSDTKKFESLFFERPLKHSPQLSGSPLLGLDSHLLSRFELRQSQRRKVGIHQNENHIYLLKMCNAYFTIGKVHLWLYKGNIGFITIGIGTDSIEHSTLLDLVSRLSNVIVKSKIMFEQPIAKGRFKTISTSIRQIMDNICNLQEEAKIKPFDSAYKKAICLFYGFGSIENDDNLLNFLEMLRRQNPSNRRVALGLQSEHCFHPFEYITCAISENVVAVVGDLKSAGEANKQFLMDNGGLRQSIFSNYLSVYLNCLSIYLRLKRLQNNFNIYDVSALRSCPDEAVCELHDIMNTPLYDLTNEWHINELFKTYLCDCALGISEKIQKLSGGENRLYIEEIYNKVINIDKRTERMEQHLNAVVNFVENDLNKWLFTAKSGLRYTLNDEDDDAIVSGL